MSLIAPPPPEISIPLTFKATTDNVGTQALFKSNQSITLPAAGAHRVRLRALIRRNAGTTTVGVWLSNDATKAYHLNAQSDTNVVAYYWSGTVDSSRGATGVQGGNNFIGAQELELSVTFNPDGNVLWGHANGYFIKPPQIDTNIVLPGSTLFAYILANAAGDVGPAYASIL